MRGSTISGTVTQTVVPGKEGNYPGRLSITDTGVIAPTAYGTDGIYAPADLQHAVVINHGSVSGAYGGHGSAALAGGAGIDFAGGGKLTNTGTISGGQGGYYSGLRGRNGLSGGNGVDLTLGGHIDNSGRMTGGDGGVAAQGLPGYGGTGVNDLDGTITNTAAGILAGGYGSGIGVVLGPSGSLNNHGLVLGGAGNMVEGGLVPGTGGYAALLTGGTLTNLGQIEGGAGGIGNSAGGVGVDIRSGTLTNSGTVTGGSGGPISTGSAGYGHGGAGIDSYGTVLNTGVVIGGTGNAAQGTGGPGGYGVILRGGTFTNDGEVTGGAGGTTSSAYGGAGGSGVSLRGGTFLNNGIIMGGLNSNTGRGTNMAGAAGARVDGGTLTNAGTIIAATSYDQQNGGVGLYAGVENSSSLGTVFNAGLILGGAGSAESLGHNGGNGGTGVVVQDGGSFTNTGTIIGGTGGTYYGLGGAGVTIQSGGTLITAGTITGGTGGKSPGGGTEPSGAALVFGSGGGTLVIDPGAVFNGAVDGNGTANSVVVLGAGSATGTIGGIGAAIASVINLQVQAGATWDMEGKNTLPADSLLTDAGSLTVTGTLTDTGPVAVSGALDVSGTALVIGVTLDGGTLTASTHGNLVIGGVKGGTAGTITVESGAAVTGFGAITLAPVMDDGTITAHGGALSITDAVTGTGTLAIAASSTLLAGAAITGVSLDFAAAGTLSLATPSSVTSTISGFQSGDVVDLQNLVATTLTYHGGTLILSNDQTVVDKLYFAGSYKADDFALKSDGANGTDIIYAGPQAPEFGSASLQGLFMNGDAREAAPVFWHDAEPNALTWLLAFKSG
jgi:hypothetical protein